MAVKTRSIPWQYSRFLLSFYCSFQEVWKTYRLLVLKIFSEQKYEYKWAISDLVQPRNFMAKFETGSARFHRKNIRYFTRSPYWRFDIMDQEIRIVIIGDIANVSPFHASSRVIISTNMICLVNAKTTYSHAINWNIVWKWKTEKFHASRIPMNDRWSITQLVKD